ncbi:MAG: hypothetical protein RR971_03920, partial [Alistipes sp.]
TILGIIIIMYDVSVPNLSETMSRMVNNIALIGFCLGTIFVSCSREKIEDELIAKLRLDSLLIALYVNYGLLIVAALTVYDIDFLNIMLYNLFTTPLLFFILFRFKLWLLRKEVRDEE